jgi:glycosyltransferase involved in cell wall biosynthesis
MKVFLVVYGCEPNQGGEHEVGWRIASELAKEVDLTVLTRKANRAEIIKQNKDINFVYIENNLGMKIKPKGKFSYIYYFLWQWSAFLYLFKTVKPNDIVHLLTFGNIHLPHFLFLLRSKLVIGPMGGGAVINTSLVFRTSIITKIKVFIHKVINKSVSYNPIYHFLFKKCQRIVVRTTDTLNIIPNAYQSKCKVLLETGVNNNQLYFHEKIRALTRIVTTAKLIERKNIDQVVEVFLALEKRNSTENMTLDILGDGPLKNELVNRYGHYNNITFHGNVPHQDIIGWLKNSDLFLFCSIHEGGTHSLFEAAMANLPIACYNVSGMCEFPPQGCAIKITPEENIHSNIEKLAEQIMIKYRDNKFNSIAENAINSLNNKFNWDSISNEFLCMYKEL